MAADRRERPRPAQSATPASGPEIRNVPKAPPRRKPLPAAPSGRRRILLAGAVALVGLFALLSILSYGGANDEAILDDLSVLDAFRVSFDDDVRGLVSGLRNGLGLFGAFTARFLVDLTVGYFSIVFPLLLMMWCVVLGAGWRRQTPVLVTNYTLLYTLLLPSAIGALRHSVDGIGKEWCGVTGAFLAELLVSLLGSIGAFLFLLAALGAATVYLFNVDIAAAGARAAALGRSLIAAWNERRAGLSTATSPAGGSRAAGQTVIRDPDGGEEEEEEISEGYAGDDAGELPPPMRGEDGRRPGRYGREADGGPDPGERMTAEGGAAPAGDGGEVPIDIRRRAPEEEEEAGPPAGGDATRGPAARGAAPRSGAAGPAAEAEEEIDYAFPSVEILDAPRQSETPDRDELEANAGLVRSKLAHFGVEIESVSVTPGPVITLYELVPASGVKISRIVSLADDLALALAARGIRIMAPIPGKSAVGVEIPNRNPAMVSLRSVVNSQKFRESRGSLPIALGKGISGDVIVDDLAKMPHLLIAGATGSGKSVGINTIMASLLFRLHPSEVKFVIIDPKKIELTSYAKLSHHYLAIAPDIGKEIITTPEDAVGVLRSVELEMERRYDLLAAAGVRSIQDYNERWKGGRLRNTDALVHRKLPFLVVVIDELADLMLTAAREVEDPIARLAQLARAVGIHLILATQRPSVDVITGVIKANFPARIAFQVSSRVDSRTILDMNGADQLLGSGDMLYLPAGSPKPFRIQNAFISTEEIERMTEHISRQEGFSRPFQLPSVLERKRSAAKGGAGQRDEFFEEAARLIVRHQQGSVSLLQRRLKVGYSRAARLVDELESAGIVGPYDGSKAREVLLESDEQLDMLLKSLDE